MSEIKFSKNFSDQSVRSGANAGFQFEFYCERCGDKWLSEFVPFRGGQASSWLGRAAGMFGGVLGKATSAAEGLAQAGYGSAHDEAVRGDDVRPGAGTRARQARRPGLGSSAFPR